MQQQKAALEKKAAAESAAVEQDKALLADLEKRSAAEKAMVAQLGQVSEAERAAAQPKVEAAKQQIAVLAAEMQKVSDSLKAKLGTPAAPKSDEIKARIAQQTAEATKLREERAKQAAGSPEYAAADGKVQAKKQEIANSEAALADAAKAPDATIAAKKSPAAEELAKVDAAIAQATAQMATAKTEVERWKRAQLFQVVHDTRSAVVDKQAQLEGFVQAAKDALAPADGVRAEIVALEKSVAELPATLRAKEAELATRGKLLSHLLKNSQRCRHARGKGEGLCRRGGGVKAHRWQCRRAFQKARSADSGSGETPRSPQRQDRRNAGIRRGGWQGAGKEGRDRTDHRRTCLGQGRQAWRRLTGRQSSARRGGQSQRCRGVCAECRQECDRSGGRC